MFAEEPQEILERSQALRTELKAWERAFAAEHDGRKPGREDIREDANIASKYKEYTNLRSQATNKAIPSKICPSPSKDPSSSSPKRKASTSIVEDGFSRPAKTPRRHAVPTTPSKFAHPAQLDPYDSPSVVRKLQFTPSVTHTPHHQRLLAVVGPTPQRDGKVLGLFDLLEDTPQKEGQSEDASNIRRDQHKTPSKPTAAGMDSEFVTPLKHSRTPASSSRRFFLDMFVTPSKKRDTTTTLLENGEEKGGVTDTPSFLRRRNRQFGGREPFSTSFMQRKPPGKSLSALIADLRKLENDKADEELDILRELEEEAEAELGVGVGVESGSKQTGTTKTSLDPTTGKNDNDDKRLDGPTRILPDGEVVKDVIPEDTAAPTGSKKVWKKRGQKRTTKRVIIRPSLKSITNPPVKTTPSSFPSILHDDDDDDSSNENEKENNANDDTYKPGHKNNKGDRKQDEGDDNENDTQKEKKMKEKSKKKGINANATSHANFRRLKLRNRNSKGRGGGGGGRFGGGRRGGRR
ncbi:MAG: hypothetical protein M1823_004995 [Watsoniomyces obsoletus]|nr:MAG: hypothetical protein M1823_004995 [Watsoniomyces obsoletus]